MMPSLRLAVYCAFGAVLWIAAFMAPDFAIIALIYDLVLLLVAALDLLLSPRPREWELRREIEEKMNLGAANSVTLHARWRSNRADGRSIKLIIRDEPPVSWPVEASTEAASTEAASTGADVTDRSQRLSVLPRTAVAGETLPPLPRVEVNVAAGEESGAAYRVLPTRRGDWQFGALSARYSTLLGLWHRQFRREATQNVRVYPDASEVRRYELRLRQGRLQDIGLHLLRLRGRGTEYESLRDYTTDDEYKDINWKASARRGKLIATNYEIERDQTIIIAIDCGRMMTALAHARAARTAAPHSKALATAGISSFDSPQNRTQSTLEEENPVANAVANAVALSKLDCAINAAVLLSHVAAGMGDAVGLLLFSDDVKSWVPPRKGRLQTGAIIEALYNAQPQLIEPDYGGAYTYLLSRKLRRSLVVTFTDLIDPFASRELIVASGALRRGHNALCVTISNRDVSELAGQMPPDMSALYQKAMAQRMLSQRNAALENLRRQGVGILDVDASQLTISTVNRYLDLKARAAL
jgi:uncharacterized protein (DUF58 family)